MLRSFAWKSFGALACLMFAIGPLGAAPTAEQLRVRNSLVAQVRKAGNLYSQGKFEQSGRLVHQVRQRTEKLLAEGDEELVELMQPVRRRLERARALLESKGVKLPPLEKPGDTSDASDTSDAGNASDAQTTSAADDISFASDIAPVLSTNCRGCHVNSPRRPRARLNLSTFQGLIDGGQSGSPVVRGDPMESLLIQRIKGTGEGQRMPAGRDPLSEEEIARFEKWIAQGADFDGDNENQNIVRLAAVTQARNMTHEELSEERAELAQRNWRLGMDKMAYDNVETENFLLLGNVGQAVLEDCAKRAEAVVPRVAKWLAAPRDEPLIKGRLTLYLFKQRYDYSEFAQMVEEREVPKSWRGHWQYDVVDAYGAMIVPRDQKYTVEGLVAQQLAGIYVSSLAELPRWFSEGTGRAIASRLSPRDQRIRRWDQALPGILRSMSKPDDFLTGKLPPEEADAVSYKFVQFLMNDSRRFSGLLSALRDGQNFDRAFATAYSVPPSQATEAWAGRVAGGRGRRR